jgi:hypothetical protein
VTRFSLFSFVLLVILSGCTVTQPTPTPPPKRIETIDDGITRLLEEAQTAFDENRLTTPPEHSAYQRYLDVLSSEPANEKALAGINTIVEQYLSWALNQAEIGHYRRAREYVDKARWVDGTHPNIDPVFNAIIEREKAIVTRFDLNLDAVHNRRVSKLLLRHISRQIRPDTTFVTIQAPDDTTGRWLYQQLNDRVDFRIQAKFERSSNPAILLSR